VPGPVYVVVSIPVKVDGGLVMVALLALLNVCEVVAKSDAVVAGPNSVLPFSEVNDVLDPTEKKV
jgi:NaMN:DMB phosphoribosyltransferase